MVNELFVVGGPQGRFLIEETDGEIEVTNQIDRVVEKEGKEKYGIEKKFSKKIKNFKEQTNKKLQKVKKDKK